MKMMVAELKTAPSANNVARSVDAVDWKQETILLKRKQKIFFKSYSYCTVLNRFIPTIAQCFTSFLTKVHPHSTI